MATLTIITTPDQDAALAFRKLDAMQYIQTLLDNLVDSVVEEKLGALRIQLRTAKPAGGGALLDAALIQATTLPKKP